MLQKQSTTDKNVFQRNKAITQATRRFPGNMLHTDSKNADYAERLQDNTTERGD